MQRLGERGRAGLGPAAAVAVDVVGRAVGGALLGLSLRVLDAYGEGRHQDFLLVSSIDLPILHHVFAPSGDVQRRVYSSSLPSRAGDRTFVVGAVS